MVSQDDPVQRFLSDGYQESGHLAKLLLESGLIDEDRRDALYLALIDIAESIQAAYSRIIPALLALNESETDNLWDALFDLRTEFRHIDYHIHDAGLDEWSWPNVRAQGENTREL